MVDRFARTGGPGGRDLAITVLGEITATLDGRVLDLGGRRQRAVLTVLLLGRGEVVSMDRVIDSVWGDEATPNAAGAVQAYVSHLRRRLEPGQTARSRGNVIVSRPPGYAVVLGPDAVDAWRFERLVREAGATDDPARMKAALTEALGLWRGPALAEYADLPWAEPEALRLAELREVARERLAAARLALGESAVLVPELEVLVAEQPLREERWRLLVLALYRAQRQADALAALRRARGTLAEQLGIDPGPALRALETDVLTQSPSLDTPAARAPAARAPAAPRGARGASAAPAAPVAPAAWAAPVTPGTPVGPEPAQQGRPAPPADGLVDRDQELAELRGRLGDALAGQARLVLVEGPPGIGKSRLLTEARRMAAGTGILPLAARGSQLEKEFGFGVVRQLFEGLLTDATNRDVLLAGAAAPAGSVFDLAGAASPLRHDNGFAVLHGLYWLTANLATRSPLALIVDDLQWCDPASVRFLTYLTRRMEGLPVLLVASLRTGEDYDHALLGELEFDPLTTVVRPGTLSLSGVGDLVRRGLGEDAEERFVAACHRTTSGNPLLLRQLLRALEAGEVRPTASHVDTVSAIGSRAVSGMVLIRLRRMPPPAMAVARAIAVLGDGATLPAVAVLAEVEEAAAAAAISALARAEVIRHEYPLGFVHPLVRDAVYLDLTPGDRQLHHDRAARVLAGLAAAAEHIAAHLLQVPHRADPWVVEILREAARTAAKRAAPDGAATYLRRALAEPPVPAQRPAVLLELGRYETLSDGPAALAHLREAYDDPHTDPATFAEAAQVLLHTLIFAGPQSEIGEFARSATARMAPEFADERQAVLALERVAAFMHSGEPGIWAGADRPPVTGGGLGAQMLASQCSWELLIGGDRRDEAVELARFATRDGTLVREEPGLFWVIAGLVLELADEDTGAFWDEALTVAHTRGSLFSVLAAHLWRGYRQWRRGDLPEAYQSLSTAIEQNERWGGIAALGIAYGEAFLIGTMVDQGRLAEARAFLERRRPRLRIGDGARLFDQALARLLIAEGCAADALDLLDRYPTAVFGTANPVWYEGRSLRASALAALGRPAEALVLAEEDHAQQARWGAPSLNGRALRLVGELRGGAAGLAELREAVALLAPTGVRLEHGRALAALAAALPAGEERTAVLRQALRLAEACGAAGLRAELASRLARAGVAVPAEPDGAVTLTTTERRMTAMAIDGADDRDIAQALFLTPRSVADALAAVRDRLGVSSVDELRQVLAAA